MTPEHRLSVMQPGQSLSQSTARIITALEPVGDSHRLEVEIPERLTPLVDAGDRVSSALANADVPAEEVGAINGHLTATGAESAGFLTVWNCVDSRPMASSGTKSPSIANRKTSPVRALVIWSMPATVCSKLPGVRVSPSCRRFS